MSPTAPNGRRVKTGGRKKGTPNKAISKLPYIPALADKGEAPRDFLLRVMRDEQQPMEMRVTAAKAAAPYCHPQLKSIEVSGPGGGPLEFRVTLAFD